jgi:hypothetical protein
LTSRMICSDRHFSSRKKPLSLTAALNVSEISLIVEKIRR